MRGFVEFMEFVICYAFPILIMIIFAVQYLYKYFKTQRSILILFIGLCFLLSGITFIIAQAIFKYILIGSIILAISYELIYNRGSFIRKQTVLESTCWIFLISMAILLLIGFIILFISE